MFVKIDSIYDFISLFAVLANVYILYSLEPILILGSGLCLFFHDFLKEVTTGWYAPIFKRPNGAMDCSLFNSGGLVDYKSGFPSGHVTIVSFLMNILWLRNTRFIKPDNIDNNLINTWSSYIRYNFPIVLMGYARIMKGCHNLIQVVAGYLLGYAVAKLLYYYENDITYNLEKTYYYVFNKNKVEIDR